MDISGTTKLLPIIGAPVAGVVSPPGMNDWFRTRGIDCRMLPLDVPAPVLTEFWTLLRASETFLGCSITYPHKQAAFQEADRVTDRAGRIRAVNTLRREGGALVGDMTDGLALMEALRVSGVPVAGRSAHIMGAGGGAGRAIADALCETGVSDVVLSDTDEGRLAETAAILRAHWPKVRIWEEDRAADILIDATPTGKDQTAGPLFPAERIRECMAVCDIAGLQGESKFLRLAAELGKQIVDAAALGRGQISVQTSFVFKDA